MKNRKAKIYHCGQILVIRMTGGSDCLWLNMYLDTEAWQMTCDSDIGSYAYHWGKGTSHTENFIEFCYRWLADESWLLRKCVGERNVEKRFNHQETVEALRDTFVLHLDMDKVDFDDIDYVFGIADGYLNSAEAWSAALKIAADNLSIELPEEWYRVIRYDYTPQQKRFAEICREVIAPELKKLVEGERRLLNDC